MPPIKLIATDIDGTLLSPERIITERSLRAIRAAREKGITVAIATGRFPENVYLMLEDYGLRLPIIGVNGARVVDENLREISCRPMERESARAAMNVLLKAGSDFFIFGDHAICTASAQRKHHSELSQRDRITEFGFRYYHGREEAEDFVSQHPVYKFFVPNNVPLSIVREALSAVKGIDLTQSWVDNIEIMPSGVNKGLGVRDLAESMGISMDQVMTLGDQDNDIPMLKAAGFGVAMGNASEETKKAARFVTASYAEEGFAKALETYALS